MQHIATFLERVERLKNALSIKSDDAMAARLGISKRTLNYAKLENKAGIKTVIAFESAERAAGLAPPEPVAPSPAEDQSKPSGPQVDALSTGVLNAVRTVVREEMKEIRTEILAEIAELLGKRKKKESEK